ncbi:MAG: chemotaxis protein CheW [Zoogloea sp.]|uniref:chemotaxis protein CheW n=1 Tax=Zoogloea sp. TaxID=49181 RepID=UPI003F2AAC60
MSIDMSQFYQVFFEETAEHLANMESMLLALDVANPDSEELNAIFRAAHSIKGSAGTFGFTDLAEVTHILENLLDRVRKGEMPLQDMMIDAFLDAGDVLKALLAAHRGEGAVDRSLVDDICFRLRELTNADSSSPGADAESAPIVVTPTPASAVSSPKPAATTTYKLRFRVQGGAQSAKLFAENLLAELREIGAVAVTHSPATADDYWQVAVDTAISADELREVLEFVVDTDSLSIAASDDASSKVTDEAYGFFEPVGDDASPPADEACGFFEPLTSQESGQASEPGFKDDAGGAYGFFDSEPLAYEAPKTEEAYGFFEPLPATDQGANFPAVGADVSPQDESYGFFAPLPASDGPLNPSSEPAPEEKTSPHAADDPAGAFGFFKPLEPVPASVAATEALTPAAPVVPAPVAPPVVASAKESGRAKSPASGGAETTIRVGVEKVDQLINLIGELVITQAMLAQSASVLDPVAFERLHNGLIQLERNTRDLQESVMSIRMMPISVVFSRFPRVVRDLSSKLGKKVELKTIGENTELDKGLIERIADPLTHLVRNSLDHGIEPADVRLAKGKQPSGTITLKAYHQSGHIVIEVSDDGAGLNRQKILSKAKERGLPVHDAMTDHEVWQLIFEAGFSTADQITEVSGRGVGMDVVKRNISELGGRIEIDSMTGIGTRMTVRLPLTLAILDGMSVAVGGDTYIIPLGYVKESLQATASMIKSVSGVERLVQVREEYLPIIVLHELFGIREAVSTLDQGIMVVLDLDGTKAALFVDALLGQHQVVIKSLEANYRRVAGVSGATIMGDGHVALILDVSALIAMAKSVVAHKE